MKIKEFKNGAYVAQDEPSHPTGMITVTARNPSGEIIDKIRCDTKSEARAYFKAFCALAKNS